VRTFALLSKQGQETMSMNERLFQIAIIFLGPFFAFSGTIFLILQAVIGIPFRLFRSSTVGPMALSHKPIAREGFYLQHYYVDANVATVEKARRSLPGIAEIQEEDNGKSLIRFLGNEEDLKDHFGKQLIHVSPRKLDDEDALYMKYTGNHDQQSGKIHQP
jgi:hypothetical protein